jgi:hypothetical protein
MTYEEARKIVKRKPLWLVRSDYNFMRNRLQKNLTESEKLELLALEIILFDLVNGKAMPSTLSQTLQA